MSHSARVKKIILRFVMLSLLTGLGGCAVTPKRAYDGPELPKSQLARIRTYTFNTMFVDVDQKHVFLIPDQRLATDFVDVLPGRHVVRLHYQSNGLSFSFSDGEVELDAIAGHVYLPRAEVYGDQVRFRLEDGGTDYEQRCPYKANIVVQTQRAASPAGC